MASASLYAHVPFCFAKCDYCDFFSLPCGTAGVDDGYVRALANEARWYARRYGIARWRTVYVGGGTPSLLSARQLEGLVRGLCESADGMGSPDEVTVEMNPETVTADRLSALAAAGCTRISLGVQCLDDAALAAVHRHCSAGAARAAMDLAGSVWRGAVSVDAIAGLPGVSEEAFLASLRGLVSYGFGHLSLYTLTVEEGTPLAARPGCWDADAADALWLAGRDALGAAGLAQYEVSNFARPGCESLHNMAYWRQQDYVGVGAGATGTLYGSGALLGGGASGIRWTNTVDVEAYTAFWQRPPLADAGSLPRNVEPLDLPTEEFEFLMMGLRMRDGVSAAEYRGRYARLAPWYGDLAARLAAGGLWQAWEERGLCLARNGRDGIRYALSKDGLLFLNSFLRCL